MSRLKGNTTILTFLGILLGCSTIVIVEHYRMVHTKSQIATYLAKHHCKKNEVNGVLSNMTSNYHNLYDETF